MPVLKPGQTGSLMRTAVVLDMGDVEAHAQRVLTDAHDGAAAIVEQAELRARHLTANADQLGREAGYERGLREGRDEGLRQGREEAMTQTRAELAELSARWQAAIEQWESCREQMHAEACEDVLRFAFALGERVVHRLLRVDPSIVRDQLTAAVRLLGRASALQISINPEDRGVLEQVVPDVAASLGRAAHVHLHDDATVARGGCVLATTGGYVDATIDTQLDRLAEALLREGRLVRRIARSAPADTAARPTGNMSGDAP